MPTIKKKKDTASKMKSRFLASAPVRVAFVTMMVQSRQQIVVQGYDAGGGSDGGEPNSVAIGNNALTGTPNSVAVGVGAEADVGSDAVAVGPATQATGANSVAIGNGVSVSFGNY